MKLLRLTAAWIFLVSSFGTIANASDTPLIEVGAPLLQSKDRLAAVWNELSSDQRKDIQGYLLSLGLSSTGRIQLIGSFRQTTPTGKDRTILQFQQADLEGTRLFWSVLVDPDALEARKIFALSDEPLSSEFRPISRKQ